MAAVVVFGARDTAELAYRYLREDSPHEVVAFTVGADYRQSHTFSVCLWFRSRRCRPTIHRINASVSSR